MNTATDVLGVDTAARCPVDFTDAVRVSFLGG